MKVEKTFKRRIKVKPRLIDYTINAPDGVGDFVKCTSCGTRMIVDLGEEKCPHCGKIGNLMWATDKNGNTPQEVSAYDIFVVETCGEDGEVDNSYFDLWMQGK